MNSDITILLLTHKSKNLVVEYVKNLYKKFKIIVIDNSNDIELKDYMKINFPEINVKLIENKGYGNAINFGSKFVKTKYFLASNPDLQGITEESLKKFLNTAIQLKDQFSTIGPRYENVNPKSLVQSDLNYEISEIKVISGACMFFNKKNFDQIGGFDENFFLYFEENDFCLRAFPLYKNYQINSIKVNHDAGNSVNVKNEEEKELHENFRTWHFMWSKFYFYKKQYNFLLALIYFLPILLRLLIRIIFHSIINDKKKSNKYKARFSGLINSILGYKSSYRIN